MNILKRYCYYILLLFTLLSACKRAEKEYVKIPLEDFFRNPEKSRMQLSPNGEFVSYVKNYKNRANIFCENLSTGIVTQLTFDTTRGISNYVWVNNKQLLYLLDVDGNETFHLFSINNDGKNKVDLTPFDNIQMNFIDIAPQKDDEIYICLNKRNPEIFDLYKLNYNTGALKMVDENPGNITEWSVDLDGQIRLAVSTDGVNEKVLYKKTTSSPYKEVLTINFKETFYPLSFTKDGHSIYALSNINRDKVALVVFDLDLAKETKIIYQAIDADINDVFISYTSHMPIYASYRAGRLKTHFFDHTLENIEQVAKKIDANSNFSIINNTTDDKKYLLKLYSDKNSGRYFTYNVETEEMKEIGKTSPWLKEENLAETNSFEFKTRDGLTVQAYLTLPNEKQDKYPLLVIAHQHLWQRTNWSFNPEVQFFANRGYAVLRVNHRGVEGFGKNFHEAGFKEIGAKMQDDYTDAVYYLIKKGIVDTARIGIYGMSFGGYFALNGLVRDSGLYKCAASYSGFTNLFSYLKEFPPYYNQFIEMMYEMIGNPETDADHLKECSPAFHTDKMKSPIFIAHGEKDRRSSVEEINLFVKNLKNEKVRVNYLLVPDEGHVFRKEENKINLYRELEMFFDENLMNRK